MYSASASASVRVPSRRKVRAHASGVATPAQPGRKMCSEEAALRGAQPAVDEKEIDEKADRRLHDSNRDRLADADVVSDDEHQDPADQRDDPGDDEEPEEGERRHYYCDQDGDEQAPRQRIARVSRG